MKPFYAYDVLTPKHNSGTCACLKLKRRHVMRVLLVKAGGATSATAAVWSPLSSNASTISVTLVLNYLVLFFCQIVSIVPQHFPASTSLCYFTNPLLHGRGPHPCQTIPRYHVIFPYDIQVAQTRERNNHCSLDRFVLPNQPTAIIPDHKDRKKKSQQRLSSQPYHTYDTKGDKKRNQKRRTSETNKSLSL